MAVYKNGASRHLEHLILNAGYITYTHIVGPLMG
jgi:hypothetical protein